MIRIYQIMHYLIDMFNTIYDWWNIVMNSERNPLKNIQDLHVRHLIMQILAWMWCIIFSLWIGSMWVFGFTAVLHLLLIFGIVMTVGVFEAAKRKPSFFLRNGYHTPSRSRSIWIDGKKVKLDDDDTGGEHQ